MRGMRALPTPDAACKSRVHCRRRYREPSFAAAEVSPCGQGKEVGLVSYSTTLTPPLWSDPSRSRWGSEGLKCGGWVMKGRATFWNYFRSGKWQFGGDNQFAHPGQWNEYEVPVNSLRLPNATDEAQCGWRVIKYIKWLFGQKIYEGPPQIPIQQ